MRFYLSIIPISGFFLIIVFCFAGKYAEGQTTTARIDSLKKELLKAGEDSNKVEILRQLGNEVGYIDPEQALEYAQEGYNLSNKINYEFGIGTMAYILGFLNQDLNNYALSDSFLILAEEKFRELDLPGQLAKVEHARGVQAYKQGNYWMAADFFAKNVKIFEDIKDSSSATIAYQSLIAVLGQVKNHEKAIELSKKALLLAKQTNDTVSINYLLQLLVTNLVNADRMDEASDYITRLREIAETVTDQFLAGDLYSTIGTYFYRYKDFPQAVVFYEKALEKSILINDKYQQANHYNALGQAYLEMGRPDDCRDHLFASLQLAREYQNKRGEYNVSLSLSNYYKSIKDFYKAYEYLSWHQEMTDSIMKEETRNYTAYLEASFEAGKKENEIFRLEKVQQEKEYQLKRSTLLLFVGAGLVAALLIILYLLRRNHRNKEKIAAERSALLEEKVKNIEKEQQIVSLQSMINGQETERTRIAKELHDGLGSVFSTVKMHYSTLQQGTPEIKGNPLYRKTLDLIDKASDELRTVAHNMMPEVLMKVGLVDALQDFCNNINSGKLLTIRLQTYGMDKRLSSSTETMLYRIVQELIHNILKHAEATEALIQINRQESRLSLIIDDNGRGFDTREASEKRTMGMSTVKSRVDYLNGRLTIDSRKDIGTTIMIDLLINE